MKNLLLLTILLSSFSLSLLAQESPPVDETTPPKKPKKEKVNKKELRKANYTLWLSEKRYMMDMTDKYINRLKNKITNNQIIGLEVLIAAPTDARIESMWGHSMLRFVDNTGSQADDMVLGFVAEVDDVKLNNIKGLGINGGYPVFPDVQTLRLFNQQYLKVEDRPIDRFIIPSTKEQRARLVDMVVKGWGEIKAKDDIAYNKAVAEARQRAEAKLKPGLILEEVYADNDDIIAFYITDPNDEKVEINEIVNYKAARADIFGKYTFFGNNCAGALYNLLQKANFYTNDNLAIASRIPIKMEVRFKKRGVLYFPKATIPSILFLKQKLKGLLKVDEELFYDFFAWPDNAGKIINENLSNYEKFLLLDTYSLLRDDVQAEIVKSTKNVTRPTYDELFRIQAFPEIVYELCQTKDCVTKQMSAAYKTWDKKEIDHQLSRVRFPETIEFQNYYQFIFNGGN